MTEQNREYILELFKIVGTTSILVVDCKGILKRIYCPFRVIAIIDLSPIKKGAVYKVDAVKMTIDLLEVYIIEGKGYYAWIFRIL